MRILILIAAFGCVFSSPFLSDASSDEALQKQRHTNQMLYKITEPIQPNFADLKEAAKTFNPEADKSLYKDNGEAVTALCKEVKEDRVLQKNHWFSLFNNRHREEALMFFEALLNSKTWNTFSNTAAHYREKLNEGVFTYGYYVAVIHSNLGKGIVLPPLYEVTPHMFANSEIIQQAYSSKMKNTPGKFRMSFTGTQKNPEQRVAYFGEDIGLNIHHVTWHMDYPFWWKDSYGYHLDRKGELFFWVHHQLTARFDAERLSNNLDVVDELYWDRPIYEGFAPHTTYKYGGEFPARPDNVNFEDVDGVGKIRDMLIYENRIRDAIAHGYITARDGSIVNIRNENGIESLGDIIESSEYSDNTQYYGALHNLAHIILGRQGDPKGKFAAPPGVMEHFETATRDPAFFRLHKYMDNIFKEHKYSLPPYNSKDIAFPDVAIEAIGINGKLETFFEDFEFELGNGVDDVEGKADIGFELTATVSRLNHEPFSWTIEASNNNKQNVLATVRIFICPNKDVNGITYTFQDGIWNCIEVDKFWRTLKPGTNSIVRSAQESSVTVPDVPSYRTISEKTGAAFRTGAPLQISEYSRSCGIPNRLLLPKGKVEGMEFAYFVVLSDGERDTVSPDLEKTDPISHSHCGIQGEAYPDKRPLGYPFDRLIPDDRIYKELKNMKYKIVKIHHRE